MKSVKLYYVYTSNKNVYNQLIDTFQINGLKINPNKAPFIFKAVVKLQNLKAAI